MMSISTEQSVCVGGTELMTWNKKEEKKNNDGLTFKTMLKKVRERKFKHNHFHGDITHAFTVKFVFTCRCSGFPKANKTSDKHWSEVKDLPQSANFTGTAQLNPIRQSKTTSPTRTSMVFFLNVILKCRIRQNQIYKETQNFTIFVFSQYTVFNHPTYCFTFLDPPNVSGIWRILQDNQIQFVENIKFKTWDMN